MSAKRKISESTFIKNVPPAKYRSLCDLLMGRYEPWKELACHIKTKKSAQLKFTNDDIQKLEMQRHPAEGLLNAWSTDLPSIGDLIRVLREAGLLRVVVYIQTDILNNSDDQDAVQTNELHTDDFEPLKRGICRYSYETVARWTNDFDTEPVQRGGNFIGLGGFGKVYYGCARDKATIAVKRLERIDANLQRQFAAEIQALSVYQHANLVNLRGYCDGPVHYCIIYEFVERGSLFDHLICKDGCTPLQADRRLDIAIGTARGLNFLHTFLDKPLVHRDIKTSNILLGEDYEAKIGDFGLARIVHGDQSGDGEHTCTQLVVGTRVYMPPEYLLHGQISVKTDAYSYGMVLLELITGLPVYDTNRYIVSLDVLVKSSLGELSSLVDVKAGQWLPSVTLPLFHMAVKKEKYLLAPQEENRLTISEVLPLLEELVAAGDLPSTTVTKNCDGGI